MKNLELKSKEELIEEINRLSNLTSSKSRNYLKQHLQEDTINLIFETIPHGVNVLNEQGIIIDCNKSLVNLHGYTNKTELIGQHYSILFPESEIERSLNDIAIINEKGIAHGLKYNLKRKDGSTFPVEISSSFFKDETTNEIFLVSTAVDISERLKIEETLQENEQMKIMLSEVKDYKNIIIELVENPIFLKDNDHKIVFANKAFFNLFGLEENSVIGKTLAENVPENEMQHFLKIDRNVLETGVSDFREEELTVGSLTHTILTKKTRIIDESGKKFLVGSITDITQRKLSQKIIEENEERYRNLVDSTDGIVWEADAQTFKFSFVSNKAERLLGFPIDDWYQEGFWENHIYDEDRDYAINLCASQTKQNIDYDFEYRFICKNGEIVWLRDIVNVVSKDNKPCLLRGLMIDITKQKQLDYEYKLAHQHYLNTLENMSDGFVSLNTEWIYTAVNKTAAEMFGRKPEDLIGKHIWTEFPEGVGQPFYNNYYKAVETKTAINFEDYYRPWDKWYENRVIPIENGLSIFFHEITARKKSEKEILERQEVFSSLFHESADPILLLDDTGFTDCNQAALSILGYNSIQEVINKKPWEISPQKQPDGQPSKEKAESMINIALQNGYNRFEWTHIKSDGTEFPVEIMLTAIILNGKQSFYTIWRDFTERLKTEEELKNYRENLEQLVKERTLQLEEKNVMLDRINKLFVGRELRMKELKEKIEKLKPE